MERDVSFAGRMIPGSPATLANIIEELVVDGGIDSIQLLFPDYLKGLNTFHAEVMPLLQRREFAHGELGLTSLGTKFASLWITRLALK
jgi:alkanesulfonate monooxygenase SsuD/methylene tetrahydromethanopterin reductase-like flavin-dependent oxidoreductase (luciferase family)